RRILSLELGVETTIEENQKTETGRSYLRPLACPGIRSHSRGMVQPVAGVGEGLVQGRKQFITGIIILVESEIVPASLGAAKRSEEHEHCKESASSEPIVPDFRC